MTGIGSRLVRIASQVAELRPLEIDVTLDDPKAYTRPWTVRVNQRLLRDTELIEFVCLENQAFDPVTGGPRRR